MLVENLSKVKNIKVINLINEDIKVYADIDMLKTILRNLISNAIKYSNDFGKIILKAQKKNNCIEISITDFGIGMNKDTKAKLFKELEINSELGTSGEKGTGFGLLICKEFVLKHNGKIWVESELNYGSVFNFTMPLKQNNYELHND